MSSLSTQLRAWLIAGAAAAGIAVGAAGVASAASDTTSTSSGATSGQSGSTTYQSSDPRLGHGPAETLLTGTTAAKVKAAALAAVPGGTVTRLETDSDGAAYEAHVTKSDGTVVTVEVDSSFKVTATEQGFGRGNCPDAADGSTGSSDSSSGTSGSTSSSAQGTSSASA